MEPPAYSKDQTSSVLCYPEDSDDFRTRLRDFTRDIVHGEDLQILCGSLGRFKLALDMDTPIKRRDRLSDIAHSFAGVPVTEDWRVPDNTVVLKCGVEVKYILVLPNEG